jgi:hypothetical protein
MFSSKHYCYLTGSNNLTWACLLTKVDKKQRTHLKLVCISCVFDLVSVTDWLSLDVCRATLPHRQLWRCLLVWSTSPSKMCSEIELFHLPMNNGSDGNTTESSNYCWLRRVLSIPVCFDLTDWYVFTYTEMRFFQILILLLLDWSVFCLCLFLMFTSSVCWCQQFLTSVLNSYCWCYDFLKRRMNLRDME